MAKAAGRQAGKIRLQQGNESWGLQHIEQRHGAEIRDAGFADVPAFVADIAQHIDQVWKPAATRQLVALHKVGNNRMMFVELQPGKDEAGDFYTVNTAFTSRKAEKKGWKLLWEARAQASGESGNRPSFAVSPPVAGGEVTNPSSQSSDPIITPPSADKPAAKPKSKPATKPEGKLEDAGEKLGGARKDQLRTVRERLDDMGDEAIAGSSLSQLWPKGEIDKISGQFEAALYHVVRSLIPAKPRVPYRVKAWVAKVKAARDILTTMGALGADATVEKMRAYSPSLNIVADQIEVLMAVDRSQWGRIGSVRRASGRYNKDGDGVMVPGSWVTVEIDGRSSSFYGKDTVASALPEIKEQIEGKQAPEKRMKFAIYTDRQTSDVFVVKDGDAEMRRLKTFKTVKEARGFLSDEYESAVALWDAVKNRDNVTRADVRRSANDPRAGRDHRNGKDVTPEQFLEAFGFRGVEFGNWVKQGTGGRDRQSMLNGAYDAFMDMAEVLDMPPKALSLDGKLGIGFGSRGSGKASAHFEPDLVVINLTKTKGAGTLAHEWFHALDNYFARRRAEQPGSDISMTSREEAYITYRPERMLVNKKYPSMRMARAELSRYQADHPNAPIYQESNWETDPNHPKGVRPQVEKAFAELVATLNASPMLQRAKVIDGKTSDGYWARIIERGARSFETYVIARLADQGFRNDYLANVQTLEQFSRDPGRYPYLTPDEQGPVNEAFDKLFATLETKEDTAGNVALFSRASGPIDPTGLSESSMVAGKVPENPISLEQAIAAAEQFLSDYNGNIELNYRIRKKQDELYGPGSIAKIGVIKGAYHPGRGLFTLAADHLSSAADAYETLRHEILGHYGLDTFSPQDKQALLDKILASKEDPSLKLIWDDIAVLYKDKSQNVQAEEVFARLAESTRNGKEKLADLLFSLLTRLLRKVFGYKKGIITRRELLREVEVISKGIRSGNRPRQTFDSETNLRRGEQTETPAFKRWFGASRVVDKQGEPKILYHGTGEDFTVFDQGRSGSSTRHNTAPLGIFMTGGLDTAQAYADKASDGMPGYARIMQLYAAIRNPYLMSAGESQAIESPGDAVTFRAKLEREGYDGINLQGTDTWIAFSNTQVKSATDNNGEFDEWSGDIRFSRSDTQDTADALRKLGLAGQDADGIIAQIKGMTLGGLKAKLAGWSKRSEEGLFDGLNGIKRAEEAVGITDVNDQGYVSARMATGLADVMHGVLHYAAPEWRDGVIAGKADTRGVLEVLGDLGQDNLTPWLAWLGGKRAQMLKAQGRENNLTETDIAELLAMGKGNEVLFERVYQDYAKTNEAVLDLAEQAGLIDKDARAKWATEYYVPFYRQTEDDGLFTGPRSKKGLSHQTAAIKALKGGTLPTNDLLTNMLAGWTKRIDAAMKNKALTEVVDNLKDSEFLTDESPRYQQVLISRSQIAQQIRNDRKALAMAADMLGLPEGSKFIRVANQLMKPENEGFEKLWTKVAPTDPDIIRLQRGGKSEYYRVNDESLLRGLKFIEGSVFNDPITRIGRTFKRLLTTGVTASPDFILRNFIRDAAHAWMINKDGFVIGKDSIKGMRDALREDQDYRDLMFAGGSFQGGYVHGTDPEASAQIIRRALEKKGFTKQQQSAYLGSLINTPAKAAAMLGKGWQAYRTVGDKVENANRLSTYKAALAAGKSKRQAAYEAKDLMDYSMRGNFAAAQWFTDVVPFLNARMQGLYKLGRAVKGDKTLIAKEVAMKGAYIALFSLLLAGINDDDERYKALMDWDKDMHWHIFLGEQHFRIPKPFELGLIFGTVPERLLHAITGTQDGGDLAGAVSRGVFQTLAFNPVPQFYQPIRELQANRNFFRDMPIEDMSDEGKLPEARFDERTSALGRAAGQLTGPALGLSPKQLDHLVQGYTGTLGGYVLSVSSMIAGAFDEADRPAVRASDLPVVKVLYQGSDVRSTQYQAQFYDMMQEAEQLHRTVKSYRDEGRVEAAASLMEGSRDKLKHRMALGMARQQLGAVRKQMDAVYRDTGMSGEAKRAKLDQLQVRSNQIAERIVRRAEGDF